MYKAFLQTYEIFFGAVVNIFIVCDSYSFRAEIFRALRKGVITTAVILLRRPESAVQSVLTVCMKRDTFEKAIPEFLEGKMALVPNALVR